MVLLTERMSASVAPREAQLPADVSLVVGFPPVPLSPWGLLLRRVWESPP